ncbi:hypothetical protein Rhopal_001541-T1 [Rhodotorula paludigena]|uniref:BRCT domain-containing protein n=1 Tax=Rhodotorula paludigena TaxID=86838 RepID=A0AAV5GG79_9BASI|nr:hypothetical protein Rhopal_001541-T1 [Rhodotorula paludigena]
MGDETDVVAETETEAQEPPLTAQGAELQSPRRTRRAAQTYGASAKRRKSKGAVQQEEHEFDQAAEEDEVDELEDALDAAAAAPSAARAKKGKDKGKEKETTPPPTPKRTTRSRKKVAAQPSQPAAASSSAKSPANGTARANKQKKAVSSAEEDSGEEESTASAHSADEQDEQGGLSDAGSADELDDRHPPKIFMHPSLRSETGWAADKIWIHHDWVKAGKREKVVQFVKDNGGKVMKDILHAEIAVLPQWTADSYADLYVEAMDGNGHSPSPQPVTYTWLQHAASLTARDGRPTRPPPGDYTAPRPKQQSSSRPSDLRSMRYQKMTEAEMERSAELWLRVEAGMSRREACERLQHEFYTRAQSYRTTTSAFEAAWTLQEDEIKQRAKRLRRAYEARLPTPEPEEGQLDDASQDEAGSLDGANAEASDDDELHELDLAPRKKPDRRPSPSPAPALDADPDPSFAASLTRLSTRFRRPLAYVRSLVLACTLDVARAERVLAQLAEYDLVVSGLSAADERADKRAAELWERIRTRFEVWSLEDDAVVREIGDEADEEGVLEAVERLGRKWSAQQVAERWEVLRALGEEGETEWELARDELRRMRDEAELESSQEGNESV